MSRQVFLSDQEIKIINDALRSKVYRLLADSKKENSGYESSPVIRECVDMSIQESQKLIFFFDQVLDGKAQRQLEEAKSRL